MSEQVKSLFSTISTRYDRANALLSLGLHRHWNRQLVKALPHEGPVLDLCAGTGAIAEVFLNSSADRAVTLLDFCPEMLAIAQTRLSHHPHTTFLTADAQQTDLPSASFPAISMAYGIRNLSDRQQGLNEARRLLQPGGTFGILELTRPTHLPLRLAHKLWLATALPLFGRFYVGNTPAYHYLARTIHQFPDPDILKTDLHRAGFSQVSVKPLTGGIATLFLASAL